MVKVKNPLFSLGARGLVGAISFVQRRRTKIAEKTPVVPDAKSPTQLSWRTMYQQCTALWHLLSAAEKAVWESQARPRHMTGYAWFQSQCLRPNPGIYLPLAGGTMAGDIDMAGHKVEDLPDPAAAQEPVTRQYFEDNLPAGGYTEGARVFHSVDQAIPATTWTAFSFNSELYDTDSIHDNVVSNSRLTCKTAGKYIIVSTSEIEVNVAGVRAFRIRLNGVTWISCWEAGKNLMMYVAASLSSVYDLSIGDYVEVLVWQNSGGPLNIRALPQFSPHFMMQRIG